MNKFINLPKPNPLSKIRVGSGGITQMKTKERVKDKLEKFFDDNL